MLVKEFAKPGRGPQPYILEEHQQYAKTRTVNVIWDELEDLTLEQRYDAILDAYRRAEGEPAANEIISVTGLTGEEAVAYGLLPYRVEPGPLLPNKRRGDKGTTKEILAAIKEEATQTIAGPSAKQLRYVRREDAEAACRRLRQKVPGYHWEVREGEEERED
ncbi:MAG TPA: hypothetical protein VKA46_05075 [Gemmataceae bacterium]|nr:hypothetical protein [Gemmataceae bacterium]